MFTTVCSDKRRRAPAAGQFRPAMLQRPSVRLLSQLWPLAAYLMMVLAGDCPQYIGEFRDCTCGLSYRDEEVRCCTADTCQAPLLSSTNLSCPFACQNGGTLKERERDCSCPPGFFGVCCERETEDCGGLHFTPTGVLSSPGYPDPYNNSVRCVWRISTDRIRRVALGHTGGTFEVELGTTRHSCNHDWVAVYDGASHRSPLIGRFCGSTMPTVKSSGSHMLVEFSSDWQQRRQGFQLHYVTFFAVEQCGRTRFSRQTGIILSPHYPLPYPPSVSCSYSIAVRPGHMVTLSTEVLELPGSRDCRVGDRITVSHDRQRDPLYVLCGSELFQPVHIINSSLVTLKFSSDCHSSAYLSEGRFKLRFEQIPDFT